jgi:hypothetical protein
VHIEPDPVSHRAARSPLKGYACVARQ